MIADDLGAGPPFDGAACAEALAGLLRALKSAGYRFVVPTPETHSRVLRRDRQAAAADLRDVFGWNKPFEPPALGELFGPLRQAGLLVRAGGGWRSLVRVASLGDDLYLHSGFPTTAKDAVFLGPDSYRFARLIRQELAQGRFQRAVDMGGGAGVGAVTLARCAQVEELVMTDINPAALFLARINAREADVALALVAAGSLEGVAGDVDLVIANPPFIAESGRAYSDGGDLRGAGLARDWACAALDRLRPGGSLVMYAGSPVVGGSDQLWGAIEQRISGAARWCKYEEIDPDIFGEELDRPVYEGVERIAAVSLVVHKA